MSDLPRVSVLLMLMLGACPNEPESPPPPRDTGPCDLECVSCPEEMSVRWVCNPCTGETWVCTNATCEGDTVNGDYPLAWTSSSYACECIDEDGNPETSNPECFDSYTD